MTRFARATDANQAAVTKTLRAAGAWCVSLHKAGDGLPDLLCWVGPAMGSLRPGRWVLLEVKDGNQPPSRQQLTPAQQRFHYGCPGEIHVVRSPEDALRKLGLVRSTG